jgi:hypothetical protein
VRKLIIAHHWAGYPKVKEKENEHSRTDIHVTIKCLYGRYWKTTTFYIRSAFLADYDYKTKKKKKKYEGFPAAIVATTGLPQNLFKYTR